MLQDNLEPEHPIGSMEKINANLLAKIRTAAFPDELSAVAVRLSVAKNVFVVSASVYFTCYLFAIGGFEPSVTGPAASAEPWLAGKRAEPSSIALDGLPGGTPLAGPPSGPKPNGVRQRGGRGFCDFFVKSRFCLGFLFRLEE